MSIWEMLFILALAAIALFMITHDKKQYNMKWIKLTHKNEPEGEVLAGNFAPGTYGYTEKLVGHISYDEHEETWSCESDGEILENVTHFVDINKYDL